MIMNVSQFRGTSGSKNTGKLLGNSPMSPTVRMSRPSAMDTAVSTTMVTNGEGTALVR